MPVPHDPALRARRTYEWRDETYHLLAEPGPMVVLLSDSVTKRTPYNTLADAEAALWDAVVTTILAARTFTDPYAVWPGVELAAVRDPDSGEVHVVERSSGGCKAWRVPDLERGVLAFLGRVRLQAGDREAG